jgi:DNA-binding response OmpR family regulator
LPSNEVGMVMQSGGDCLHRTWRLAIDAEPEMRWLIPQMPMAFVEVMPSEHITAALQADAIVLAGSFTWLTPRIERIRHVGLCYLPLLAATSNADGSAILSLIQCGADDVLVGPVEPAMVLAKLHALNRRSSGTFLRAAPDVTLRPESNTLEIRGKVIRVRPTPFRLLAYLIANRGEWVSKDRILRDVFGLNRDPGTSLVRVHIHAIRRALGPLAGCVRDDPGRNRGYMFAPDAAQQTGTGELFELGKNGV